MKKKILQKISFILVGCMLFPLCACKEKLPEELTGYTKEVGEVMFREKEDRVVGDTVVYDMDICIYNYAPSILEVDENTRHAYYCSNKYTAGKLLGDSYQDIDGNPQVTDYIAYRKGVKYKGEWYWGEKKYVLKLTKNSATEGTQVCDPNVIKGEFSYDGETYPYLMAYLACATRNNTYNHVCLAVSKSPEGPWKKCVKSNPFREYSSEGVPSEMMGQYLWGHGQASMISVDKKGRVLLFYTAIKPFYNADTDSWGQGNATTFERWDLSDLNNPVMETQVERMTFNGVQRFNKPAGTVGNGDYAYDPITDRIYMITDGVFNQATKETSGAPIAYIENQSKVGVKEVGDVFAEYDKSTWQWNMVGYAKPKDTENYHQVHNTAIIRNEYGWLSNSDTLEVAITGALHESTYKIKYPQATQAEWSYRILRKMIEIK